MPPPGRLIGGHECAAWSLVTPIADRAEIAHIDPVEHPRQKARRDILDHHVLDADRADIVADQVQTEMAKGRGAAPGHIHAVAPARADNGRNLDHLAIAGEGHQRAGLDDTWNVVAGWHRRQRPRCAPAAGCRQSP